LFEKEKKTSKNNKLMAESKQKAMNESIACREGDLWKRIECVCPKDEFRKFVSHHQHPLCETEEHSKQREEKLLRIVQPPINAG
jgi:hypothetical protein